MLFGAYQAGVQAKQTRQNMLLMLSSQINRVSNILNDMQTIALFKFIIKGVL